MTTQKHQVLWVCFALFCCWFTLSGQTGIAPIEVDPKDYASFIDKYRGDVELPDLHLLFKERAQIKMLIPLTSKADDTIKWKLVKNDHLFASYDGSRLRIRGLFDQEWLLFSQTPLCSSILDGDEIQFVSHERYIELIKMTCESVKKKISCTLNGSSAHEPDKEYPLGTYTLIGNPAKDDHDICEGEDPAEEMEGSD